MDFDTTFDLEDNFGLFRSGFPKQVVLARPKTN
jgi:hypothetical protein